ncbi:hypothetical protein GBAR_LOCUS4750 [Geodia barretti]|uniref:PD-(D/E)XK endonuclease-like domain-containing protein n=1 Tax=Geodia barretti TaxID=519541 RepID=A0AA35R7Y4_GEOBA|nr:hypothetical protein GBAR_LOCUS4750 [Geodia barretti]
MAGPSRDSLADTPAGRTLLGLLDLAGKDFRRDEVMAWLTGCPVRPPRGKESTFSPSQWDAISRQAGIVGGLDQWQTRLEAFELQTMAKADSGEAAEELSVGRAAAMRASAGIAGDLREFIKDLSIAVAAPPPGSSWPTFCEWASKLLEGYIYQPPSTGDNNKQAGLEQDKKRIAQILDDLRAADSINPSASEEEFKQVLTDSMQVHQGHLGPTGQGVFVSSFASAAGMSFDAIWMLGIYSLAAQQLVPGASRFQAAYWFTSGGGGFQFAPPDFFDISDDDTAQRFREGALHIVSGIQAGVFPANPGPFSNENFANCRYCDFDRLCPARRGDIWERKKHDPKVVSYRELAEDGVQTDLDGEV